MICSKRTQAAYQYTSVTSEMEWTRSRKALDYLDLADRNSTLFDWYKRDFLSSEDEDFQTPWIMTSGKGFPVDDCRVVCDWFNSDTRSMFFHLCMKDRQLDWIGRNVFLGYVLVKMESDDKYLESGRNAVRFMDLASLCGFHLWKNSLIDDDCCIGDYIFGRIYPSILKGLYEAREDRPLLARRLLDMFHMHSKNFFMLFEMIPDDQHLQFLLDVAIGSRFEIWEVADYMDSFSYLNIIIEFIIQKRYDLILTLLRFGLQLKEEPMFWMQSIYMGLWGSPGDFTATPEFMEMLVFLFEVHMSLLDFIPTLGMIQESLTSFYHTYRATADLDAVRGKEILHELILAYETCGLGFI